MRIPYIINKNILLLFKSSEETLRLKDEVGRKLIAEDLSSSAHDLPLSLASLCVLSIANHFEEFPIINKLLLCSDRDYLLETLPVDLSLFLVIPLIEDEIYWKRRFTDYYGVASQHLHIGWTWKCIYLENYMSELIERAQPQYNDEDYMEDITNLLNPYIHRLKISQFQTWKPPLTMEKDEIPDVYPWDHINLEPIFKRLVNIEELDLLYGIKNVGENFTWSMFKISNEDAKRLGKALLHLKKLRSLRIHNSNFDDNHVQIVVKDLMKIPSLEVLDMSNCLFGDRGALCIAKLMMNHSNLQNLVLVNNSIGGRGGEGIGYALAQETCCPLKHLNLRLNPLKHKGVLGLLRALVRVHKLEELIISGCGFEDDTSLRLATLLILDNNLKFLDVSNNWCQPGEKALWDAVKKNKTLEWFDIRQTDISSDIAVKIRRKIICNRRRGSVLEEDESIEDEVEEKEEPKEEENVEQIETEIIPEEMGEEEEEEKSLTDEKE